jgi:queuosine precursor transporter
MSGIYARLAVVTAFAATIPAANWLIENVGTVCVESGPCLIPVGFGLMAPSGVLMIGAALVLRDLVHELAGWKWALFAVLIGAGLSLLTSATALAVASAAAFLFAELADFAVYSRLRDRSKALAVMASGVVGAALDSMLFVWLAFGSLEFSAGTTLAKIYASIAVAAFLTVRSRTCWLGHAWGNWYRVDIGGGYDFEARDCTRCGVCDDSDGDWIGQRP